ncbi:MAG: response regulator [Allosphingosinicella sp.]|uniref:response regulator n=1 Tax=Allosphingosinicella sp. TaxID=2823234 RepID=UPI00394A1829
MVDDDESVRTMIGRAITELGYPVHEAPDGESAIAMVREGQIQLVILDYVMPGMDGAETARQIANIDPDLPLIFSTGHSALRTLRSAAGEDVSVLEKPFTLDELGDLIQEKLAERKRKPL